MTARTTQIAKALAKARADLAHLQAERADILLGLFEAPEDTKLTALLAQVRLEIDQLSDGEKGMLPELEQLLAKAKAYDTAEAKATERVRLDDERMCADIEARGPRVKIAAKIDKAVADLGELLADWDESGASAYEHVRLFTAGACPDLEKRLRYAGDLLRHAEGHADIFRNALIGQLLSIGLFRKGIPVADISLEGLCGGPKITLEQAAELSADRMDRMLSKFDQLADGRYGAIQKGE